MHTMFEIDMIFSSWVKQVSVTWATECLYPGCVMFCVPPAKTRRKITTDISLRFSDPDFADLLRFDVTGYIHNIHTQYLRADVERRMRAMITELEELRDE